MRKELHRAVVVSSPKLHHRAYSRCLGRAAQSHHQDEKKDTAVDDIYHKNASPRSNEPRRIRDARRYNQSPYIKRQLDGRCCYAAVAKRWYHGSSCFNKDGIPGEQTTTTKPQNDKEALDYWTNDGIVEGVWMFARHGDRTPSRPLTPEHRRDDEAAFWMTKLPYPDSATAFSAFSQHYPVWQHKPNNSNSKGAPFIDVARNPFGFLTSRGLQQLHDNGQRFFKRYNNYAHHLPHQPYWNTPHEFLQAWDIKVYSTNYLRTIMSVQSFLDGMFTTHCYEPHIPSLITNTTIPRERPFDPTITKEQRIPTAVTDFDEDSPGDYLVPIQVRDLRNDPLNAFDRNPDLVADLVAQVMQDPDFLQRDGTAASLAARLANILPGLLKKKHRKPKNNNKPTKDINTNNDFTARAPSGINWVEASDHFVCRKAHDLPLSKFTDFEADDRVEQLLQALSNSTLAHLSWRFRKWYQHEPLLALIAAPPLREITTQMQKVPHLSPTDRRPFVIYSCHDITILGLLYAIGADFLAFDDDDDLNHTISGNDSGSWRYWPPYASNLVFELVRIESPTSGNHQHVVRVLLNGSPVKSAKITLSHSSSSDADAPWRDSAEHSPKGLCPDGMFSLQQWEETLDKLEEEGGLDYDTLLGRQN